MRCVVCSESGFRKRWSVDGWRVVRCSGCGLLRTDPAPDDEDLERIYESGSYLAERGIAGPHWQEPPHYLDFLPRGRVLDIGTGAGQLVVAARSRGIEMDGMDPSSEARKVARDVHGLELLAELPAHGEYAGATLIHVVEHMRDPVAELTRIRELLRPEGTLFIEVPHARSAEMIVRRRRETILDLPVHLHHFTPRTLSMVLDRAGFKATKTTLVNTRPVERMLMHKATEVPGKVLVRARGLLPGWKFYMHAAKREAP